MIEPDLRTHWKAIVLVALAAGILALVITVIVVASSRKSPVELQENNTPDIPLSIVDELELYPEKLMLPESVNEFWYGVYEPQRRQKKQWGMEELGEYYHDPLGIGTENLRELNRQFIDDLLERVP